MGSSSNRQPKPKKEGYWQEKRSSNEIHKIFINQFFGLVFRRSATISYTKIEVALEITLPKQLEPSPLVNARSPSFR